MEKIVAVIRSNGLNKLNLYDTLRAKGYRIALFTDKIQDESHCISDYLIQTNTNNTDILVSDVINFSLTHNKLVAVTSFTEFAIQQASLIAELLSLPGPSYVAISTCRNKFLTRCKLANLSLPSPKFGLIKSVEDIEEFCKEVPLPIIVKPVNYSGALGVVKIDEVHEIERKFAELAGLVNPEFSALMGKEHQHLWVAEEYISGFEISVESYTCNGETHVVAIHDKVEPVEAPFFLEEFFVTPSPRIGEELNKTIKNCVKETLRHIGFQNGITHIEFRVKDGIPYLIEINPRPGGVLVVESTYYSTGVNLLEVGVEIAMGRIVSQEPEEHTPVAFKSITAPLGTIKSITGVDDLVVNDEIKIVQVKSKVGDIVLNRSSTAAVNILVTGAKMTHLISRIREISSKINVESE